MNNNSMFDAVKERANLREYAEAVLKPKGRAWVCPACGSGSGPNGTPAFSLDPARPGKWHCFSCSRDGDVFDLAGIVNNTTDQREQCEIVARHFNVDLPEQNDRPKGLKEVYADWTVDLDGSEDEPRDDADKYAQGRKWHAEYIEYCQAYMAEGCPGWDYLTGRGYTPEQIRGMGFGYDAERRRVVIPWAGSDYYHIDRTIDEVTKANPKYTKPTAEPTDKTPIEKCVGPQPIYNPGALKSASFVAVEGVLDALAIQSCGYDAVALGGTGWRKVIADIRATNYQGAIILALDADEAGEKTAKELLADDGNEGLFIFDAKNEVGKWLRIEGAKDAQEAARIDADKLKENLGKITHTAIKRAAEERRKARKWVDMREYLKEGGDWDAERERRENMGTVSTGFKQLDKYIGGGLTPDLYLIGGGPGMGKTSLALQIADTVAAAGWPVLYVCTEQTPFELACKSIARTSYTMGAWDDNHKITALSLIQGYYPTRARVAADEYTANRTPVFIGADFDATIEDVQRQIDQYEAEIRAQGETKPLTVVIDYLQLLRSESAGNSASEREITDRKVSALKAIQKNDGGQSRIMLVLSSLNRDSYREISTSAPTLASFKESGSVEYTAAVAIMLWRFAGIEKKKLKPDQDKSDGAVIRARIVKNRYGRADRTVWLMHNKEADYLEAHDYDDMVSRGYIAASDTTEADSGQNFDI